MTSTEALELPDIPESLLVLGGGYVGLEIGSVYAALGSRVTVVELADHLLLGVDPDPQIAWCGLTEEEARSTGRSISVQRFPWKFSGRALTMGAAEGLTKIIADPQTREFSASASWVGIRKG